jgi:SAM-dependent methyltransferase
MPWWRFGRRRRPIVENTSDQAVPHHFIRGRRFVANIPYILPKDLQEVSRLDFQHYMLRYALRTNYVAPLGQPQAILDVACGTGRWAKEMAQTFPAANVIGMDITTHTTDEQSGAFSQPANYLFVQGNVLEGLSFADATFDYTHMRLMMAALPLAHWQGVVNELVRVTRPGGWIELVEGDLLYGVGPAFDQLNQWGIDLCQKRGIDLTIGPRVFNFLRETGLEPIYTQRVLIPTGQQGGRLAAMAETDYMAIFASVRGFLISLGMTSEAEYDRLFQQAQSEMRNGQTPWPFHVAYVQRR